MDKEDILNEIFDDDPLGLLNVKAKTVARTADERLSDSFQEINKFYEENKKEPEPNASNISEYQLYSRLKGLRDDSEKSILLEPEDSYGLLKVEKKEIASLDDIFDDDSIDLLGSDEENLFEFKHISKDDARAQADFVARRKPSKDFSEYEDSFKNVQKDLGSGARQLVPFKQENLKPNSFYVHNGVLLYLESVDFRKGIQEFKSGKHYRPDGRTRTFFENGTESNMMYQSLYKALQSNGKCVTKTTDEVNNDFSDKFGGILEKDSVTGFIYVLSSLSDDEEIKEIENLYKIGFSTQPVEQRIKNAKEESTYLMAPVKIEGAYKCYNLNPQKLEKILHTFFGNVKLQIDITDLEGNRRMPQEWFIVPFDVIEKAIELIISGEIVNYRFDVENMLIVSK